VDAVAGEFVGQIESLGLSASVVEHVEDEEGLHGGGF
jgi:hypothetical protein